eukprot:PhM_4_TR6815/c0_g1_i1/m.8587/K08794/CAMK1; calcium/calmodulin-dependent protein kinase I
MSSQFENEYVIGKPIGKGSYAEVFECKSKSDGRKWAVKVVDKSKTGAKDVSDVLHEVNIMRKLGQHQHIVHMREFFDIPGKMLIVMDLVEGGPLFDRVIQLKHYTEDMASKLVRNFLLGLEHMHDRGVMHRDLKPENLLLKTKQVDELGLTDLSLADFGLSGMPPSTTCCGSPSYIAPEVINVGFYRKTTEPYNEKCDLWSVGVITYILLSGKMPFHGRHHKETFEKIVRGAWAFQGDVWSTVSESARDFIKMLLVLDPKKRPSAKEALRHPWVCQQQATTHLMESLEGIKELTLQQKAKAAVLKLRLTKFFIGKTLAPTTGPAFLTYLAPTLKRGEQLNPKVLVQSQSHADRTHTVDLEMYLTAKDNAAFDCSKTCTCPSSTVCRHIQYAYTYYFVGDRETETQGAINDVLTMRSDAEADALDNPGDASAQEKLRKIDSFLTVLTTFREVIDRVPRDMFKANFNFELATSAGRAWGVVAGMT